MCDELHLRAGSVLRLERTLMKGRVVWIMTPSEPDRSWFGGAGKFARGKSHGMEAIRTSIGKALGTRKGR